MRPPETTAAAYANQLLSSLGVKGGVPDVPNEHPAISWAQSGLMALTGSPDGAGQMCPVPLAACADGALAALASLDSTGVLKKLRGSQLLAERAAIAGLTRAGKISPGVGCHLLEASDGHFALSLAREDDWALLPALLEAECTPDWESVARVAARKSVQDLVERGRMMGLAISANQATGEHPAVWCSLSPLPPGEGQGVRDPGLKIGAIPPSAFPRPAVRATFSQREKGTTPLVVDLSSLWAGPLCGRLLLQMGAHVIKVESPTRPDGARQGPADFFNLLNAGKQSLMLDPTTTSGRQELIALLSKADIVIEGSRPRALRQLGIDAEAILEINPKLTWVSITAYGRGDPQENWVGFGDDVAVAAGLSHIMGVSTGQIMFCGDAIADPLTGIHAALAAWASYRMGGGRLISVPMCEVVRHCIQFDCPDTDDAIRQRSRAWSRTVLD